MTAEDRFEVIERRVEGWIADPISVAVAPCADDRVVLRLWERPSFAPIRCWVLITGSQGSFLRRLVWDRPRDLRRSRDPLEVPAFLREREPRPSIEVCERVVTEELAEHLLARAAELARPEATADQHIVLDGVRLGLQVEAGATAIEWDEGGAGDGLALDRAFRALVEVIDDRCDEYDERRRR